jgi:L-cysteine S-thiosulfotransferase
MRWRPRLCPALLLLGLIAVMATNRAEAQQQSVRSASEFLSPALQREQSDAALNRGMLWVDHGAKLWDEPAGEAKLACSGCHGQAEQMRGAATRYPAFDTAFRTLLNLEGRINSCRERHQRASPFAYESEPLLALTALIAHQSLGLPLRVEIDGPARTYFEAGRALYTERQGQLDLACRQCHEDHVGRKLRGDTISSGIGTGYPAYRLEWQGLGSLHRRLQACQAGVRAVELSPGSTEHLALELYLAWRATGMDIEAPAIRR